MRHIGLGDQHDARVDRVEVLWLDATGTLDGFTISRAWAQNERGGGIEIDNNSTVTLSHVVFMDNHAEHGGAIYLSGGSTVTVTDAETRELALAYAELGDVLVLGAGAGAIVGGAAAHGDGGFRDESLSQLGVALKPGTSALAASSFRMARPRGSFRLSVIERLLRWMFWKSDPWRAWS